MSRAVNRAATKTLDKTRTDTNGRRSGAAADLESARRVLEMEAKGLTALAEGLGPTFTQALDVLSRIRGRVVVTGMGKSGHVARKIAATLASTGTPALYVHPAEAGHGDLGMITEADAVIALSNSGETAELAAIVEYVKRFKIPLVAVTKKAKSALGEAADMILTLPDSAEACPMGLAPTTSTTVMLALGDAIAVALLERKGFSPQDFQVFHPGGQLGRRLVRVAELMHQGDSLPVVAADATMNEAVLMITAKRLGCVGIVDSAGRLAGIITDGDLRRHIGEDFRQRRAGEFMTADPQAIRPQALASEAVSIMNAHKITQLFVVDKDRPVGIIHIHDCLKAGQEPRS